MEKIDIKKYTMYDLSFGKKIETSGQIVIPNSVIAEKVNEIIEWINDYEKADDIKRGY